MRAPRPGFPGGTAVSHLTVYDWPTADGLAGGSPHLHTASGEGYVVVGGCGRLQTLSRDGAGEHPLAEGTVLWFTPGTVHRLVNDGGLQIVVVMQNAGLPEAGDAVFTFPDDVLADPGRYAAAAALPGGDADEDADEDAVATAARRRRDLALEGFAQLRDRVAAEGPAALDRLYERAGALVAAKVPDWRGTWERTVRAGVDDTGRVLTSLADGDAGHLRAASVHVGERRERTYRYGMCGRLRTWDVAASPG
ncbi:cupin domain-containing protein [Jiangella rhizosphaerae]|uniref:Cupin domain-containing protein n=1 Tax=Jiangella rhizosphaerae TaxID=2293569 RepID=A0A418KII3_9ACTN|nr:cupin domain-containing protein [Jiangella rhizosphaerae]RIQ13251.1 cupin domain-containing protein [Jiangella rhizosphaerae]